MKKHYLIKKDNKIVYIKYESLNGFSFKPTNGIFVDDGVIVAKIIVFKPEFIELVLKKKIKNKLNLYLSLLMDDTDDSSTDPVYARSLYQDVEKYRLFVLRKYGKYLDDKYLDILSTKISLIEHELKLKMLYQMYVDEPKYEYEYEPELETSRSR